MMKARFAAVMAACIIMLGGCFLPEPINDLTVMYVTVTDEGAVDSCAVQLGPDPALPDPDLEPYMDCEITVNGVSVPYERTGSTYVSYKYSGSALSLDPGDQAVVVIRNPNLTTVELAGTMPPAVESAGMTGDLDEYLAGILDEVTMTWDEVDCTTYVPRIIRYNADQQMYSALGIYVTGLSYIFDQDALTSSQGIKATYIGFSVQGVNQYSVDGCLGNSRFWTRSTELPVASTLP